jgi:hypothetical protein
MIIFFQLNSCNLSENHQFIRTFSAIKKIVTLTPGRPHGFRLPVRQGQRGPGHGEELPLRRRGRKMQVGMEWPA